MLLTAGAIPRSTDGPDHLPGADDGSLHLHEGEPGQGLGRGAAPQTGQVLYRDARRRERLHRWGGRHRGPAQDELQFGDQVSTKTPLQKFSRKQAKEMTR